MGSIVGSKVQPDNKVVFEIMLDYEEALQIKGKLDNIHVFSQDAADMKARISQRGKNEATTYFLIPKQLRQNLHMDGAVSCQKIEGTDKTIFVYVIDKKQS